MLPGYREDISVGMSKRIYLSLSGRQRLTVGHSTTGERRGTDYVNHSLRRNIPFSPPDITDAEIAEVVETLRSGWITTGLKTKLLEQRIAEYIGARRAVCLSSATAALELTLRILGIGPGDEVITSAYTYTASASSDTPCRRQDCFGGCGSRIV